MGHGSVLAVLDPAQELVFNRGVDGLGLEGTICARDARLNASSDDGRYVDPGTVSLVLY